MIFYYVTQDNREEHRALMHEYFQRLAKVWGNIALDNFDTQNASYALCVHPEHGLIGGMRLLPTLGPKLSDESLAESGVALHDGQTWEATKLFFYLPHDHPITKDMDAYEDLCIGFYAGMWDYLQEICPVELLVTLLPESEHIDAKAFGHWPFELESTVRNPFDVNEEEYILGVLRMGEEALYAEAG